MAVMLETSSLARARSELDLIEAARDGDDRAFEALYARYHDRIGAFIRGRVRDHGRAEDIGQEVFMSALRRLRASEQSISFKPWIYEIAKNACIDEFRRSQRAREVSLDAEEGLNSSPRALHAVAPTPPAALEGKQRLEDLRGAFGGLSENHHKLLVMRELEGLSYEEIGRRTGMSRPMVESSLFRARRKLTEEYEELASGRRCQQVQLVIADGRAQSARALGARERRQLARHLAHCQPCRMTARLAGVDETLLRPRSIAAKIAALLPFPLPLWRWPWGGRGRVRGALARGGSHPVMQQAQAATDAAGPAASLGGAAVAAAVIALAGAGGAVVIAAPDHGRSAAAHGAHVTLVAPRVAATSRQPARKVRSTGGGSRSRAAAAPHGGRASSTLVRAPRTGAATQPAGHAGATSSRMAGPPAAGPVLRTVSGASGAAKGLTRTGSGAISQVAKGVTSTVHHVVNSVTNAANSTTSTLKSTMNSTTSTLKSTLNSTTSALTKTLKSTLSTVGSTASKLTLPSGTSTTGSTSSTPTSPATPSTPSSTVPTVTGAVKQLASNLLH